MLTDPAAPALRSALNQIAARGQDPAQVLAEAAADRELVTAGSLAEVMAWRLQNRREAQDHHADPLVDDGRPLPWMPPVPTVDRPTAKVGDPARRELREWAQGRAADIRERVTTLADRVAHERPTWARMLGDRPAAKEPAAQDWTQAAGLTAAYGELYDITDPEHPTGQVAPAQGQQRIAHAAVTAAIARVTSQPGQPAASQRPDRAAAAGAGEADEVRTDTSQATPADAAQDGMPRYDRVLDEQTDPAAAVSVHHPAAAAGERVPVEVIDRVGVEEHDMASPGSMVDIDPAPELDVPAGHRRAPTPAEQEAARAAAGLDDEALAAAERAAALEVDRLTRRQQSTAAEVAELSPTAEAGAGPAAREVDQRLAEAQARAAEVTAFHQAAREVAAVRDEITAAAGEVADREVDLMKASGRLAGKRRAALTEQVTALRFAQEQRMKRLTRAAAVATLWQDAAGGADQQRHTLERAAALTAAHPQDRECARQQDTERLGTQRTRLKVTTARLAVPRVTATAYSHEQATRAERQAPAPQRVDTDNLARDAASTYQPRLWARVTSSTGTTSHRTCRRHTSTA